MASLVDTAAEGEGPRFVPIDGKTLLGSHGAKGREHPLHLASAWASAQGLTLGQTAVAGTEQSFQGWRLLEAELSTVLRSAKGTRNPYGMSLIMFGLLLGASVIWWLSSDPQGVQQALNEMLRK